MFKSRVAGLWCVVAGRYKNDWRGRKGEKNGWDV